MFDAFRGRMALQGNQMGKALKRQSDVIMDATFHRDIAFRKCYIQTKGTIFPEQTLEGYRQAKSVFMGNGVYEPEELSEFEAIDAKYLVSKYYNLSGDNIDYYIQFRPNEHGRNPNIRVGALIFVPDDLGVYNLWMIVARDDRPQFPQFYILKCNLLLKWLISEEDRVKFEGMHVDTGTYFSWAIQRTQSSYNNGRWTDYLTTTVENIVKAIIPTNTETYTISYNQHFVISDNPLRRVAWEISKREDTTMRGVTHLTFAQEQEFDARDNLCWVNTTSENYSSTEFGIDYDFYQPRTNDKLQHTPTDPEEINESIITFSGISSSMKIGGSYKTFTANFCQNGQVIQRRPYWSIEYIQDDASVCKLNFIYVDNKLVCDSTNVKIANNNITYYQNGHEIFGIKYDYNAEHPTELRLKCASILNMIGNRILIIAGDAPSGSGLSASIEVEVEGL